MTVAARGKSTQTKKDNANRQRAKGKIPDRHKLNFNVKGTISDRTINLLFEWQWAQKEEDPGEVHCWNKKKAQKASPKK